MSLPLSKFQRLLNFPQLSCYFVREVATMEEVNTVEFSTMQNMYTLEDALLEARKGNLENWLHSFLLNEGLNKSLSDGLKIEPRMFHGIFKIPLQTISRCCGPEDHMKYKVPLAGFEHRIKKMQDRYRNGWSVPPLLINYSEHGFELNDGNHRYEMLKREHVKEYYVIVWTTGETDKEGFLNLVRQKVREIKQVDCE
jgi:hypothetical protein